MRDVRHALRALPFAIGVAGAAWTAPASACGPPPTLRRLAGHVERIALVRAVERRPLPPSDCACTCGPRDRVTFEVLEAWKGAPMERFELDRPSSEKPEAPVLVVGLFPGRDGPPAVFPLLGQEHVVDTDIPILRDAVGRAVALAEQGETPSPALLRVHILESLRHPITRSDGLLEAWERGSDADIHEFLSEAEASELASVVEKENPSGEALAALEPILGNRLTPGLRALALTRLDEAFASAKPDPVEWAEPLLRALGWAEPDACADAAEVEVEEPVETADTDDGSAVPTEQQLKRWEEAQARYEARERERWQQLRASWPALRRTLGG